MNRAEYKVTSGVLAAVLTPVDDALAPSIQPWIAHCRRLLDQGCDGLAVLGTTSEANSFSVPERLALLDALAEAGIPGGRVIPGTGCCAIPDTVALTRKALEIGAAGVLMLPPFYYKGVGDDGLFASYAEVIERVGDAALRIYLYHIPPMSNVPITYGLIERLRAAYPDTVVGIKDSGGDFANMTGMVEAFPGFRVFSGADTFLLPLLRAGGAGAITACNNVAAHLSVKVYADWRGAGADADQTALAAVRDTVQKFPLVAALKEIVARATGDDAWRRQRPPLETLSPAQAASLMAQLAAIGFAAKIAA
ncbi:MAG: dihydrodipicolinate synthase family protein [Alphaproteobacteria bacterium]